MANSEASAISTGTALDLRDPTTAAGPIASAEGAPRQSPKILLDGVEYDATNLSNPAMGAIASLQFAEAKLMALHNELAILQTAHFAYVKRLKADLEGKSA